MKRRYCRVTDSIKCFTKGCELYNCNIELHILRWGHDLKQWNMTNDYIVCSKSSLEKIMFKYIIQWKNRW